MKPAPLILQWSRLFRYLHMTASSISMFFRNILRCHTLMWLQLKMVTCNVAIRERSLVIYKDLFYYCFMLHHFAYPLFDWELVQFVSFMFYWSFIFTWSNLTNYYVLVSCVHNASWYSHSAFSAFFLKPSPSWRVAAFDHLFEPSLYFIALSLHFGVNLICYFIAVGLQCIGLLCYAA